MGKLSAPNFAFLNFVFLGRKFSGKKKVFGQFSDSSKFTALLSLTGHDVRHS